LPEKKLDYTFMAFAKITYSGARSTINSSKQKKIMKPKVKRLK